MSTFIKERRAQSREARKLAETFTPEVAAEHLRFEVNKIEDIDDWDKSNLHELANIIAEGSKEMAMEYCLSKDTNFRELVPKPIWAFIGGIFVYE